MTKQIITVSYVTTGTRTKNGKILRGKRKGTMSGFFATEEEAIADTNKWLTGRIGTWHDSYEITGVRIGW